MVKRRSKQDMLRNCGEIGPEDGIDPRDLLKQFASSKKDRKALQLCRQVERTISLVVSGELDDDRVRDLQLLSVTPAQHSNHLLVTFQTSSHLPGDALLELDAALFARKGQIRAAIAADINRKKTPDITLRVVNPPAESSS